MKKSFYRNIKNMIKKFTSPIEEKIIPLGELYFQCNICGRRTNAHVTNIGRETVSCLCGSTVRFRSIIHLLSSELFGKSIALTDFPIRPDILGWGMSDAGSYANALSKKLNYINTFYHQEPYLDITTPLKPEQEGILDFLISTEVFEHILPPVSVAFENAYRLLKPNGIFIFTVPFNLAEETKEHFPDIYQYELIKQLDGNTILKNITRDGREQIFEDLVFHGGAGNTVEMRVFSRNGLMKELENAGFHNIKFYNQPYWEFGIYLPHDFSLPIVARRPA